MGKLTRQDILCVLTGTAALMCLGLGYGWSVFRGSFHELFPQWTESGLSLVFSMSMIFFGIGSFVCGLLLRRFPWRHVMLLGIAVLCAGFWSISLLPARSPNSAYGLLLALYGMMGGGGIGICYNAINSSIPQFFPDIKGTVSGIMMAGYGSGALVLGMLASRLIQSEAVGLFGTFRVLAAAEAAALLLCLLCFDKKMAGVQKKDSAKSGSVWGFRPTEVLRLGSFWILQLRNILSYAACLIIIEQAGNLSRTFGMAATAGLVVSVANGLARIPSGIACDKIGSIKTLRIGNLILVGAVLCLAVLNYRSSAALFYTCFILFGLSYGITPPLSVNINEEFYGSRYRTVNYAFFSFTLAPASLMGPAVLGVLQDRFGASVELTILTVSIYAAAALLLAFLVRKPKRCGMSTCENGRTGT